MAALSGSDFGVAFLQWLVRLSGFNKPIMALEDAARRDIWLTIRPFIPVEKLSLIEHEEIRQQQEQTQEVLQRLFENVDMGVTSEEEDNAGRS